MSVTARKLWAIVGTADPAVFQVACLSVATFVGIVVGRARPRERAPDLTIWRLRHVGFSGSKYRVRQMIPASAAASRSSLSPGRARARCSSGVYSSEQRLSNPTFGAGQQRGPVTCDCGRSKLRSGLSTGPPPLVAARSVSNSSTEPVCEVRRRPCRCEVDVFIMQTRSVQASAVLL
jgi:hypothetical protein